LIVFGIFAVVAFLLVALGIPQIAHLDLLPFGLALLALHLVYPVTPWRRA
jgi:hypothetical protein